jgi:hypothetical protein
MRNADLRASEEKEMDYSLVLPGGAQFLPHLDHGPVKPTSDFYPPEL